MLDAIGVGSIDELFADIPADLRPKSFDLPAGKTENEAVSVFQRPCAPQQDRLCFLPRRRLLRSFHSRRGGYHIVAVGILHRLHPYQPEASQGTLRAIFEYQTMIAGITGLDYANASLYDGGTALYEAIAMAVRANNRKKVIIDAGVNPLFRRIMKTYVINIDIEIIEVDLKRYLPDTEKLESLLDDEHRGAGGAEPEFFRHRRRLRGPFRAGA